MIEIKTYETKGHDDFELNISRASKLTYHTCYDDEKVPQGTLISIPGFGPDSNPEYQHNLMKFIAEQYNYMVIFVEYHAIFSRLDNNASLAFDELDTELLIDTIKKYNIVLDDNNLDFNSIVQSIEKNIVEQKSLGKIGNDYQEKITATFFPAKNEYQNFGILQSIDIITALYDLQNRGFKELLEEKNIILLGSSHGGYIANLLTKIAPKTFDALIDNSSYVKPPLNYIVGKEIDINKPEFDIKLNSVKITIFTAALWTTNKLSPYYFNDSAYEIRDLSNKTFLEKAVKEYDLKTKFISYHSKLDKKVAPYINKLEYYDLLKKLGIDAILYTIDNESQIDGKFIKNLNHAMGMSNKELIKHTLPAIIKELTSSTPTDIHSRSSVTYKTSLNDIYEFRFEEDNFKAQLIKAPNE